jgi:hypothetical protein
MLEANGHIVKKGTTYNWVDHIINILKTNCEGCQELNKAIRYHSLLISISMSKKFPDEKASFIFPNIPSMWKFMCFASRWKGKIDEYTS